MNEELLLKQFDVMLTAALTGTRDELQALRNEVAALKKGADETAPLSARELCERWEIRAATPELELLYLARRCRAWGLAPLKGRSGWHALYRKADVVRAESFAGGRVRSRKRKVSAGRKGSAKDGKGIRSKGMPESEGRREAA